ncbi:MAG: LPXTG cell wall anchor domain-containing protein [Planctomycetes bacterium]|nr:LPXTG cell wall anchor domain-containing protein [Planctomycetota bacterium]
MESLRSLRLNCWLAPLTVAAAAGALLAWHHLADRAATRAAMAEMAAADLSALADLERSHVRPTLAAALAADPRWTSLSEISAVGDHLEGAARAGADLGIDLADPPPELIDAVDHGHCWALAPGRWAVAAPVRDDQGRTLCVLYGERVQPSAGDERSFWWSLAGLAALAGTLGGYLVRRIYRPVEFLNRQADAALAGEAAPAGAIDSLETASLRTSIVALAERYRAASPAEDSSTSPHR